MPIPEETIQQILSSTDIVELVEGYFPLKKKGQDFWAVVLSIQKNLHPLKLALPDRPTTASDATLKVMLSGL